MKRVGLILVLIALLLGVGLVAAGGDMLPRSLLSSGGGLVSQSELALHNAIGQPAVGAVQNGSTLCSGYLCGMSAPPVSGGTFHIYLPTVVR